ncbi:MerR family transcriptional regulator [Saxibacter everestensis]|uniref:MerR family transcriptional regulator n=1 Tax=Saxibacter everestensis TaxID=2909229 RepID=A0ABY8QW61_9MICO|nr:MerR family transcriptional regulator [Brevibacteriaceae bacterium ZFBP1038]
MPWSTRQIAELAGTTVKAVRHYHQVGLLEEPERAVNGYKRYEVAHLIRLLRIKRLIDLGVPLSQIAAMGAAEEHPEEALRLLDAELGASIERLQRVRAELAVILRHQAPIDLPPGFSKVAGDLSDADRALVLIYSRVFEPTAMDSLHDLLASPRSSADEDFDALRADADEATRQELAERFAPQIRRLTVEHPWLEKPALRAQYGSASGESIVVQAIADLYNPAQLDVLQRVHRILQGEAESDSDQ